MSIRYCMMDIIGSAIDAVDGEVGRILDVYFDDQSWSVRYFVVDTGTWLTRQEVLLAPAVISGGDAALKRFATRLNKRQVEDSPPVASDMPVSRQYEERLHAHYGWLPYWDLPVVPPAGGSMLQPPREEELMIAEAERGDPHLKSFRDVKGYRVEALDGRIGHVIDALVDAPAWKVQDLVLSTRNWLPGKHVVIGTGAVRDIDWAGSRVSVSMQREAIRAAPEAMI